MARWSQPVCAETVETLLIHLQRPLVEEEKIPIGQEDFDDLCPHLPFEYSGNALSAEQVSTLFRVSDDERASDAYLLCQYAIKISESGGTKRFYHAMYDVNISRVLKFILSRATDTKSIRYRNENTSTDLKRPDYGLLLYGHCILRGEEKGDDESGDPRRDLVDKLVRWTYKPLKYILGVF